jgi:hypothetical protein
MFRIDIDENYIREKCKDILKVKDLKKYIM